jgi:hypothetical protein
MDNFSAFQIGKILNFNEFQIGEIHRFELLISDWRNLK